MEKECPICMNDINNSFIITTPCKHKFCLECFLKLNDMLCPLCRNDFINSLPESIKNIIRGNKYVERKIENLNFDNLLDFPYLTA